MLPTTPLLPTGSALTIDSKGHDQKCDQSSRQRLSRLPKLSLLALTPPKDRPKRKEPVQKRQELLNCHENKQVQKLMGPTTFSIAAIGSRQEKGRALERAVGAVWTHLGYRKLRFNIHATGEEIDVEGTHVISGELLKSQCKAWGDKVDAGPLRLFFGDVEKERGQSDRVIGIFVALNGFSGTANRWHDELSDSQRSHFKKFDGDEFLGQLQEAGLVCCFELLKTRLSELTKLGFTHAELLLTERGPFWRITLGDLDKSAAYYGFLDGLALAPRREDAEYLELRVSPIAEARRVSFVGRKSLIRLLLREGECISQDVPFKTSESREDIDAVTASLVAEGLVAVNDVRVALRRELDAALAIARLSLGGDMQLDFMKSTYYCDCLPLLLLPFIEAKYALKFECGEADAVLKILSVSPLALKRALTGDAEMFRNAEQEILRVNLQDAEAVKHRRASRVMFLDRLVHDLMSDHLDNDITPLFAHHEVVVTKTSVELKLGKRTQHFLIVSSNWFAQIATAGDTIKAGQLVCADGPGPILEGADAKMAINEWASAIESYNVVIAHWSDEEAARAASNNKAVCLLAIGQHDEAIKVLEPLTNDRKLRAYALLNLARCWAKKGDEKRARDRIQLLIAETGETPQVIAAREDVERFLAESKK